MTPDALSRVICELIEPLGSLVEPPLQCPMNCPERHPHQSPLKMWECSPDGWIVRRDMTADPAMTVMLMGLPGFVSLDQVADGAEVDYEATFCGNKEHDEACANFHTARAKHLGTAVATAYVLANGLWK